MKSDSTKTLWTLSALFTTLHENLSRDRVSIYDLYRDKTENQMSKDEWKTFQTNKTKQSFLKPKIAGLWIAGTLAATEYFKEKRIVARLRAMDSELSVIRHQLAPQRIADRAPGRLWKEEFKLAASVFGLTQLVEIVAKTIPTESRTFPLAKFDVPDAFWKSSAPYIDDRGFKNRSAYLEEALLVFHQFLDDSDNGIQLQARVFGHQPELLTLETFNRLLPVGVRTRSVLFAGYDKCSGRSLSAAVVAQERAGAVDLPDLAVRALHFYSTLCRMENDAHILERLFPNGEVVPFVLVRRTQKRDHYRAPEYAS